ncbi:Myb-like domain-containing protein [Raphanus sativus]|nr:Myb-like domain-containing protein [Raphanus sativus]
MSFNTPSLVFLSYRDHALEEYTDVNLASLVEARLDIHYSKWIGDPDLSGLVTGISNVEILHLSPASADDKEVLVFFILFIKVLPFQDQTKPTSGSSWFALKLHSSTTNFKKLVALACIQFMDVGERKNVSFNRPPATVSENSKHELRRSSSSQKRLMIPASYFSLESLVVLVGLTASLLILPLVLPPLPPPPFMLLLIPIGIMVLLVVFAFMPSSSKAKDVTRTFI